MENLLTQLFQHLIALVEHKVLDVLHAEGLVPNEGQGAPRSSHDDVGAVLLQGVFVVLDGHPPKEDGDLHAGHVLGEALVLLADLEGQLSSVAHHQDRHLKGNKKNTQLHLKLHNFCFFTTV